MKRMTTDTHTVGTLFNILEFINSVDSLATGKQKVTDLVHKLIILLKNWFSNPSDPSSAVNIKMSDFSTLALKKILLDSSLKTLSSDVMLLHTSPPV